MSLPYAPISSSASTSYTGSIAKVLSLGTNVSASMLERVEFGNHSEGHLPFTASSVSGEINIPAGTYLEGPIGRLKTSASSHFLIYFNQ